MINTLKVGRKLGQWSVGGILGYLAISVGCTPVPSECTEDCGEAGAPGESSGGTASGGERPAADGGKSAGGGASAGGEANIGGEAGVEGGVGGSNMGGDPVVLVPSLEVGLDVPALLRLDQGGSVAFAVAVVRGGGFDGAVRLSLAGLPEGTNAGSALLVKGEDTSDITLIAASDGEMGGPFEVELVATSLDGELVARQTFSLLVAGSPGEVDTSFGDGGLLLAGMKELVDLEKSPSGTVFVAGNSPATLRRLGSDGSWADSSEFSQPNALSSRFSALAVDDTKVWLGIGTGASGDSFGVARLTHAGTKDASFGGDGTVVTPEVLALALRPGGDAWVVIPAEGGYYPKQIHAVGATGVMGEMLGYSTTHISLRVDGQDRLWVASTCDCSKGSGSWLRRVLSDGTEDSTFGPSYGGWYQVLTPFGASRTLGFTSSTINALDENGKLLPEFADQGALVFPSGDTAPSPKVIDVFAQSAGPIVVLETPDGRTQSELPAGVFVFDELGAAVQTFSGDGVTELNTGAPFLHSSTERLFPRKVIIDEEFKRAIVAVEVVPAGETEAVETALVRIWL
jgi:hypothetical protein